MRGIFSLGIDVELAWSVVHRSNINIQTLTEISINVRKVIDNLFGLLENHEIPATWNIIGHLILDHCSKEKLDKLPHPDMPRSNYSWLNDDWYRYDPCTDLTKDPAWYGKDIVDKVIQYVESSKVNHEIGCHSFSHLQFGDHACLEEVARAEITKCIELMKAEYNIVPKTFAFPRDYVGHVSILKELGYTSFRDVPPKLYPCLKLEKTVYNYLKTQLSLALQLLSYYFLFPPHVVTPREVLPGLWGIPGCLAYGNKPLIPLRLVTFKAIQGINKAIREGKVFLLYTHLRDFGAKRRFFSEFEKVLSFVDRKREEGELEVKTMSDVAKEFNECSGKCKEE